MEGFVIVVFEGVEAGIIVICGEGNEVGGNLGNAFHPVEGKEQDIRRCDPQVVAQYLEATEETPAIWVQLSWGDIHNAKGLANKIGKREFETKVHKKRVIHIEIMRSGHASGLVRGDDFFRTGHAKQKKMIVTVATETATGTYNRLDIFDRHIDG